MASFLPTFTNEGKSKNISTTVGELNEQDLPSELENKY